MLYCGSIIRLSIVDVTFISDIASVVGLWHANSICVYMHACTHGQGWYFISICSSSVGYVMHNVYNQTVTKLFIQSGQLYVGNCQCYGEF